jgi:hypothetical protein
MKLFEIIVIGLSLIACTGGLLWLWFDVAKQVKLYQESLFINNKDNEDD